jgi:hypothetical protein
VKGALRRDQLPLFLQTWVDKNSDHCIYTPGQIQSWSILHLNDGCWYLDCAKNFCPSEEEAIKASHDRSEVSGVVGATTQSTVDLSDEDMDTAGGSGLTEKEQMKILAKRAREAEKEERRKDKKARRAVGKAEKTAELAIAKAKEAAAKATALGSAKSGTFGGSPSTVGVSPTSSDSFSRLHLKRDATFAGLSMSRLVQGTSHALKDRVQDIQAVDECIINGSLLSIDAHLSKFQSSPKALTDFHAFLDKVICSFHLFQFFYIVFVLMLFLIH